MTSPRPLRDRVERGFRQMGWAASVIDDSGQLSLDVPDVEQPWPILVTVIESLNRVAIYSLLPVLVDQLRRPAVAQLLTSANFGLMIGNFELDLADGDVRYKTSLDLGSVELADDVLYSLLRALVEANVDAMAAYVEEIDAAAQQTFQAQ